MIPSEHTVYVSVTDVKPMTAFIKDVAAAEEHFQNLTSVEMSSLPGEAAQGMAKVRSALRHLAADQEAADGEDSCT